MYDPGRCGNQSRIPRSDVLSGPLVSASHGIKEGELEKAMQSRVRSRKNTRSGARHDLLEHSRSSSPLSFSRRRSYRSRSLLISPAARSTTSSSLRVEQSRGRMVSKNQYLAIHVSILPYPFGFFSIICLGVAHIFFYGKKKKTTPNAMELWKSYSWTRWHHLKIRLFLNKHILVLRWLTTAEDRTGSRQLAMPKTTQEKKYHSIPK